MEDLPSPNAGGCTSSTMVSVIQYPIEYTSGGIPATTTEALGSSASPLLATLTADSFAMLSAALSATVGTYRGRGSSSSADDGITTSAPILGRSLAADEVQHVKDTWPLLDWKSILSVREAHFYTGEALRRVEPDRENHDENEHTNNSNNGDDASDVVSNDGWLSKLSRLPVGSNQTAKSPSATANSNSGNHHASSPSMTPHGAGVLLRIVYGIYAGTKPPWKAPETAGSAGIPLTLIPKKYCPLDELLTTRQGRSEQDLHTLALALTVYDGQFQDGRCHGHGRLMAYTRYILECEWHQGIPRLRSGDEKYSPPVLRMISKHSSTPDMEGHNKIDPLCYPHDADDHDDDDDGPTPPARYSNTTVCSSHYMGELMMTRRGGSTSDKVEEKEEKEEENEILFNKAAVAGGGLGWLDPWHFQPHGEGEMWAIGMGTAAPSRTRERGRRYCGGWRHGVYHGFGVEWGSGALYMGSYQEGVRCGSGCLTHDAQSTMACGTWSSSSNSSSPAAGTMMDTQASLVLSLDPPVSLQGGVWGRTAATRHHFDRCTVAHSRHALSGMWEPIFFDFDVVLAHVVPSAAGSAGDGAAASSAGASSIHSIVAAVSALPEWEDALASFQRCFYFIFGACSSGHHYHDNEETGKSSHVEEGANAPSLLAQLQALSVSGNRERRSSSFTSPSWCQLSGLGLGLKSTDNTEKEDCSSFFHQRPCLHTYGSPPSLSQLRDISPEAALGLAMHYAASFVSSMRLRLMSYVAAHPASCDTSLENQQLLLRYCWDTMYALVAPLLHDLCTAAMDDDVSFAEREIRRTPSSQGSSRGWVSAGRAPTAAAATESIMTLHSLHATLDAMLAAPQLRSLLLGTTTTTDTLSSAAAAAECGLDTPEDVLLATQWGHLCVSPAVSLECRKVHAAAHGPLFRWVKKEEEEEGSSCESGLLGSTADCLTALLHQSLEKFPDDALQRQRWVSSCVLFASLSAMIASSSSSSSERFISTGHALRSVGFNPWAPILLLHYCLSAVSPSFPIPDVTRILSADMVASQQRGGAPDSDSSGASSSVGWVLEEMCEAACVLARCHPSVQRRDVHAALLNNRNGAAEAGIINGFPSLFGAMYPLHELHARTRYCVSGCGVVQLRRHQQREANRAAPLTPLGGNACLTLQPSKVFAEGSMAWELISKGVLNRTRAGMEAELHDFWALQYGHQNGPEAAPLINTKSRDGSVEESSSSLPVVADSQIIVWVVDSIKALLSPHTAARIMASAGNDGDDKDVDCGDCCIVKCTDGDWQSCQWRLFIHRYRLLLGGGGGGGDALHATPSATASSLPPLLSEEEYWYITVLQCFLGELGVALELSLRLVFEEDEFVPVVAAVTSEAALVGRRSAPMGNGGEQDSPTTMGGTHKRVDARRMFESSSSSSSSSNASTSSPPVPSAQGNAMPAGLGAHHHTRTPSHLRATAEASARTLQGKEMELVFSWPRGMVGSLVWETLGNAWSAAAIRMKNK